VLRVLDKGSTVLDLHRLGLAEGNLERFRRLLARSHGLLLVTGPTGSGKTTTLYGAIDHLRSIEKNIVTIEDPVEYQLDIINQNQVNEAVGLTFPRILRHVLRQDPDIIMVGEIRDRQTAEIAVQAALTGHLVLSTAHQRRHRRRRAAGGHGRRALSAVVGADRRDGPAPGAAHLPRMPQHLHRPARAGRTLCWQARGQVMLARGRGCRNCYDSGYKGRLAIHELIEIDRPLQSLIVADAGYEALSDHVRAAPGRASSTTASTGAGRPHHAGGDLPGGAAGVNRWPSNLALRRHAAPPPPAARRPPSPAGASASRWPTGSPSPNSSPCC
jgi:type IV pilus assembly protein PilB